MKMRKVYIVERHEEWDDRQSLEGVFTSRHKAEEHIKNLGRVLSWEPDSLFLAQVELAGEYEFVDRPFFRIVKVKVQ